MRKPIYVASFTRSLRAVSSPRFPLVQGARRSGAAVDRLSRVSPPTLAKPWFSGYVAIIDAISAPGGCRAALAAETARVAAK